VEKVDKLKRSCTRTFIFTSYIFRVGGCVEGGSNEMTFLQLITRVGQFEKITCLKLIDRT
jgi:hypothetical protein